MKNHIFKTLLLSLTVTSGLAYGYDGSQSGQSTQGQQTAQGLQNQEQATQGLQSQSGENFRDNDFRDSVRVRLDFNSNRFSGPNRVDLKRMIRRQIGFSLQRYQLDSVRLFAKSRRGGGELILNVDGREVGSARVDGNPRDYDNNNPRTYHSVVLGGWGASFDSSVVLDTRGDIKILSGEAFLRRQ